jgi:NADH-quinone oxidoreductase subunit G
VESTWDEAIAALVAELAKFQNGRLGVIASSGLTTEELFLIREIFRGALGSPVTASVPAPPGYSDNFLIKADKNPNTLGAALLALSGPGVPEAASIVDQALEGRIEALWVFGHDLSQLCGEDTLQELSRRLRFSTLPWYHWVLPTAAYVEKDGTFVNCHGRIQRIGRAFPPLPGSREDWSLLLEIVRQMGLAGVNLDGVNPAWRNPQEIFLGLAAAEAPFAGLSYEKIGSQGVALALPAPVGGSVAP